MIDSRKISTYCLAFSLLLIFSAGCKKDPIELEEPVGFTLKIPAGFPEMPFPIDNQFSQDRWQLGKKLFFDPILSRDGTISCSTCHKPELAFADDRAFSPGIKNRPGVRNSTALANIGYHPYFLREGSVPTLEMQVLVPVQEHNEFDHSMPEIAEKLNLLPEYVALSKDAYGKDPDPWVITRALGVFQRTLISGESAYDSYNYGGDNSALTADQIRGMNLFFSNRTNCSSCHNGFNFTNYSFENNGLDSVYTDPLRMRFTNNSSDRGKAKVPSLRNVGLTAPYMHDGRFQYLEQVVEHYNSGGKNNPNKSSLVQPLNLNPQEKSDLTAFLNSLTDHQFSNNKYFKNEN